MSETEALQFVSRFALPPNSLKFCGRGSTPEIFKKCIIGGDCSGVTEEIDKFIVLNPYLSTIAKIAGKDKYSYSVMESYWLGNDDLRKAKQEHYSILLTALKKQGVPSEVIEKLRVKKPKKFIPFHLFHILHAGVDQTSGTISDNLDAINNCMIRWGKVVKLGRKYLTVNLNSLKLNGKQLKLTLKESKCQFIPDFFEDLKKGDVVAVHWKLAVKKINKKEISEILFWTKKVMKQISGSEVGLSAGPV